MKYSTPDDEEENLGPSKSALKREMTALQKLGVALVALSRDQLKKVDMPERLRDAIHDAQRFTQHEAHRRQLQYIGKVMRDIDSAPLQV
jgi:ribosome-associated protein